MPLPDDAKPSIPNAELALRDRPSTGLGPLLDRAREYARASKAVGTRRSYASSWRKFTGWCDARGFVALPSTPETVVAFVSDIAEELKPITIKKVLAAVSEAHRTAGHSSPTTSQPVRLVLQGLRRTHGMASTPKAALRVEHLRRIVKALPDSVLGTRDRAILLLGFAGGLRRSEVVGLDVEDLAFQPEGLVITLRRSKTDQEGLGRKVPVPLGSRPETCPVTAVRRWLKAGHVTEGPLFVRLDNGTQGQRLDGRAVAHVVQRAARRAGLDASLLAGHSLRRGFATEAARAGAGEREIARVTGHRSMVVLRGYIDEGTMFENTAAARLDL